MRKSTESSLAQLNLSLSPIYFSSVSPFYHRCVYLIQVFRLIHLHLSHSHVKELEHRSTLFEQAMADLADTNRRYDECRHMVDALRSENQRLSAENQRLSAALAAAGGGGAGSVFPPPHQPQPLDPNLTATAPPTTSTAASAPAPTESSTNTTAAAHAEEIAVENLVDDGAEGHESDETAGEDSRQPKRAKR